MKQSIFTTLLLIILVSFFSLGLFMPTMNHAGHIAQCPFASEETVACITPLAHLKHWQDSFTAIFTQTESFFAGIILIFTIPIFFIGFDPRYERYRTRMQNPVRPSLFQELYAQGILNRKAP